jgi:uncharacterized protein YcfJ
VRTLFLTTALLIGVVSAAPQARAIGCLAGGAAGAVAGHMAGHGVLGALGGCVAGHAWKKHKLRQQDYQSTSTYDTGRRQYDPNYTSPYSR